jgi:uncharacterized protein YijF (DUF1287 family)
MKISFFILYALLCPSDFLFAQQDLHHELSAEAINLTKVNVRYDPAYYKIAYPGGDVPPDKGVCTDVVIRAYRKLGIDLQQKVHEDMKENFDKYPKNWGLSKTDTNIDHRRVPNLMKFFSRHGATLETKTLSSLYKPGDIVAWMLNNGLFHIGIVIDKKSTDSERPLIVHNIGNGQEISDCLFKYKIIGHYRYPL